MICNRGLHDSRGVLNVTKPDSDIPMKSCPVSLLPGEVQDSLVGTLLASQRIRTVW